MILAGLPVRAAAAVLAVGLVAAAGVAGLGWALARAWERDHQRERIEALLAVALPDLGTACFLEDRALGERAVGDLARSPDLHRAALRTPRGVLAEAQGAGPQPDPPPPWTRAIPSPLAKDTEVGQLLLEPDTGEVRRRALAAAVLAGAAALAAVLAVVPVQALVLRREVVRPLDGLARQASRSGAGVQLEPPPGHDEDAIGRLVAAVNGMVRRVADVAWRLEEAGAARPSRPAPDRVAPGAAGVFLVRQDGALEAWTPALPDLLAGGSGPPSPGTRLPALFGPAAGRVEALLAECARLGRASAVLGLDQPPGSPARWVHLVLEQTGPGWIQGAVQDATAGMAALARMAPAGGSGPGQDHPGPGALHGL